MDIEGLLDELGRRMNFGTLKLDANDVCRIVFDERMVVDLELDRPSGVTCLHGVVATQDACAAEGVLEELLAANLLGVNGHDNYMSLDTEQREVVLFSRLPAGDLDYEGFVERLEHFVNDLEHWLDLFDGARVGGGATTTDAHRPARRSTPEPGTGAGSEAVAAPEEPTPPPETAFRGIRV